MRFSKLPIYAQVIRIWLHGGWSRVVSLLVMITRSQTLRELPYDKWREYDAEDTVRFYALRLHETGFIKSDPQRIISQGTNWRFLDELRHELKT